MKKILPVLVAVVLILVIGGAVAGQYLYRKYSYTKEEMDMREYYGVDGEESAIILQDERVEEKALVRDGVCYLGLGTVKKYLNDGFYWDSREKLLLYTTAIATTRTETGSDSYLVASSPVQATDGVVTWEHPITFEKDAELYIAADFVKLYTNFSYEVFDLHVQIYTEWGERQTAVIKKKTAVRYRGGVKSPVLRYLEEGETIEILEDLEDWSEVKTSDSIIGYVENKRLKDYDTETEIPVESYIAPEYTGHGLTGKVNLGFHSIGGVGGNITLEDMLKEGKNINVIAPTWFSIMDNQGNLRNFGEASYVKQAHDRGVSVWGVVDNFNVELDTGTSIDTYEILSATSTRTGLIRRIVDAALELGLDGINIDFEALSRECGEHYGQFLRELSVECRAEGLVFSVDNYVPANYNEHYRIDIQGEVTDYVIIMGYDEHWHGSGNPGSVASIEYVANGIDKALEYVPAQKVVNALPLYMILWRVEGGKVTDDFVTMANVAELLKTVGAEAQWDETACQNYVEWQQGNARYMMWIEDEKSISVKLNTMSSKNIGGVAVWRLGYGTAAVWDLIDLYVKMGN